MTIYREFSLKFKKVKKIRIFLLLGMTIYGG
jgi:hypothetical protein